MSVSGNFKRFADQVKQELVVKPLIESYMVQAKFPKVFDVTFRDEGGARKPDGFFHPSSHPLLGERQLYYYLTQPDEWIPEVFAYENRMAVIMGTAVHSFVQTCMIDAGILIKPKGTCEACGRPHGNRKNQCEEFGALDPVLGRRGHMDGILQVAGWGRGLFEFKTINPRAAGWGEGALADGDLDWLKRKHYDYYLQVQEYMEMTGMAKAVILFCIIGFPWKLVEIEVPFDHVAAEQTKAKYRRVREAISDGAPPDPCCGPRSKEAKACPARDVCAIGRL